MATYLENLKTRRDAVAAQLAALTGTTGVGAKPNANGDGVNVDHVGYRRSLLDELKQLEDMISRAGDVAIHETEGWAE